MSRIVPVKVPIFFSVRSRGRCGIKTQLGYCVSANLFTKTLLFTESITLVQ